MKTMKLGKTGIDISRIGLGTWSIGGGSAWGGDHDLQVVVDTIREAPKAGVNLIDTAPGYNFGNSEKILGKALEGMNREDLVIITKCGVTWDQEMKGDMFNVVNGILQELKQRVRKERDQGISGAYGNRLCRCIYDALAVNRRLSVLRADRKDNGCT